MESQRTRPSRPILKHALAGLIAASLPSGPPHRPPPKESDAESRAKKAAESPLKLILQSATIIREKPKDPPKPALHLRLRPWRPLRVARGACERPTGGSRYGGQGLG